MMAESLKREYANAACRMPDRWQSFISGSADMSRRFGWQVEDLQHSRAVMEAALFVLCYFRVRVA